MEDTAGPGSPLQIQVECVTGPFGETLPKRLRFGKCAKDFIDCLEIIDQWHGNDHRYFKIRAEGGELYIIRLDTRSGHWNLTLYTSEQYLTGRTAESLSNREIQYIRLS